MYFLQMYSDHTTELAAHCLSSRWQEQNMALHLETAL